MKLKEWISDILLIAVAISLISLPFLIADNNDELHMMNYAFTTPINQPVVINGPSKGEAK